MSSTSGKRMSVSEKWWIYIVQAIKYGFQYAVNVKEDVFLVLSVVGNR